MGKKSGRTGGDAAKGATTFVLKVPMHCRCDGCADKIRAAVKDLTLNHEGIEALDQSALWTKGELRVASTADPEKLRRRLHKATGKSVGLVILKPQAAAEKEATARAAALEELLRRSLQQQQQQGQGQGQYAHGQATWPNQALPVAYGYGAAAPAYHPWAVQVQQAEAYPSYQSAYPAPAAAGGGWGAYAYPPSAPPHLGHGVYGAGWPY